MMVKQRTTSASQLKRFTHNILSSWPALLRHASFRLAIADYLVILALILCS